MKFQASGKYTEGASDYDPTTNPGDILEEHILNLPEMGDVAALDLALIGAGAETITLDLYFLIDEEGESGDITKYIGAGKRWFQFATGIVVTNGTLQSVTSGLPAGGVVYAEMTAETLTSEQTRVLRAAWRAA